MVHRKEEEEDMQYMAAVGDEVKVFLCAYEGSINNLIPQDAVKNLRPEGIDMKNIGLKKSEDFAFTVGKRRGKGATNIMY